MRLLMGLGLAAVLAFSSFGPQGATASPVVEDAATCTGQTLVLAESGSTEAEERPNAAVPEVVSSDVDYDSGGVRIRSFISRPAKAGRHPAVVVIHSIVGLVPDIKDFAQDLAREGFVALAIGWQTREADPPDSMVMQDITNGLKWLNSQEYVDPQRVAIAGFCRGGGLVFLAMAQMEGFKAGIAFYGFPFYRNPDAKKPSHAFDLAEGIQSPLLMLHGHADTAARIGDIYRYVDRLGELGKSFQLKVYSGMGHGFFNSGNPNYDPEAAADAWKETLTFLRKHLPAITWEEQFRASHGRDPGPQDMTDRAWSLEFLAKMGRPPTEEDWQRHYLEARR